MDAGPPAAHRQSNEVLAPSSVREVTKSCLREEFVSHSPSCSLALPSPLSSPKVHQTVTFYFNSRGRETDLFSTIRFVRNAHKSSGGFQTVCPEAGTSEGFSHPPHTPHPSSTCRIKASPLPPSRGTTGNPTGVPLGRE